jgi:parallel beta-helix repeat protein
MSPSKFLIISIFIITGLALGTFSIVQGDINEKINYQGKLTDASGDPVSDDAYNMVFKLYTLAGGGAAIWTESWTDTALFTETGATDYTADHADCGGAGYDKITYTTDTNEGTLAAGQYLWDMTKKESAIIKSVSTAGAGGYICLYDTYSAWDDNDDITNRIYVKSGLFSVMLGTITSLSSVDFNQTLYLGVTVGGDSEMKPRKVLGMVPAAAVAKNARTTVTKVVAANDSQNKDKADYVCDGTNDEEEIQDALDILPASGGEVRLLEGTYNIEASINLDTNQTLRGDGRNTILTSSTGDLPLIYAGGSEGNELTGITITDLQLDGGAADTGIWFYYVDYSSILNVYSNNFLAGDLQSGIRLVNSDFNTILGNTCQNNGGSGIFLHDSNNNTVTGNTCQGNYNGIFLASSSNSNTITGNTCQGNDEAGIFFSESDNNTVTANTCLENSQETDNTYDDIYLESSNYNNIQGNTCRAGLEADVPRYGINISDVASDGNLVINNDLYDDGFGTGSFNDSGTGTVVYGNRIGAGATEEYIFNIKAASASSALTVIQSGSGEAAKITNTGSGNTLLIEDEASDTSPFVIDADGNVGIGIATPGARLDLGTIDTDDQIALKITGNADNNYETVYGGYNTFTASGLASAVYGGYNTLTASVGNALAYGSYNEFTASANYAQAYGGYNIFGISGGMAQGYGISNDFTISEGGGFGVFNTFTVGVGGSGSGIYNLMRTSNDAYAQEVYGIETHLLTYSGALDVAYGEYITDDYSGNSTGGTQYGLYVDLDDPDVTNYSIWVEPGSGISYFGSNVGIGTATPSEKLQVYAGNILQTPANPNYNGGADSINAGNGTDDFYSVYVSGRYAYIGKGGYNSGTCSAADRTGCELQIYDISNPSSPSYVGGADSVNAGNGIDLFYSLYVSGRYAYIGKMGNNGTCSAADRTGCELQIYDISNPSSPSYVGGADSINTGNGTDIFISLYVSGRYAYIGKNGNSGTCSAADRTGCELQIYDISNPSSPSYIGGADSVNAGNGTNSFYSLYISGRYAYIGKIGNNGTCSAADRTGCELQIYDISNPSSPSYVGGADSVNAGNGNDNFTSLYVSGRYAYIGKFGNSGTCSAADRTGCELQIYDISGVEATSVVAHSLEAGNLQVRNDIILQGQLQITGGGGINIGEGGLFSSGALSVYNQGYFADNVGIGTTSPGARLDLGTIDTDGQIALKMGVTANGYEVIYGGYNTFTATESTVYGNYNTITASDNGANVYGVYNILTGIGGLYGTYNTFENSSGYGVAYGGYNAFTGKNYAYGSYNTFTNNTVAYGSYNVFTSNSSAYGSYNEMATVDNEYSEILYGIQTRLQTYSGASDIAYGEHISDNDGNSTGGTQYGLYVNLSDPDVTNYSIWVEPDSGISYFGSNVGIGTSNPSSFALQVAGDIGPDSPPTNNVYTIDSAGDVGRGASIYCPTATDCKISYVDETNGYLKFADCDDATCSSKTLTTVDSSGDVYVFTSIYCPTADDCKIAYTTNEYDLDLKLADCNDAACTSPTLTTIDSTGEVGFNPSIYCPAADDCKIAYYDSTNGDLKFADCDNATCSSKTLTTVDSTNDVGEVPSIYCPTATDCKISYYDNTNNALKFADCDNATCSSKTLTAIDSTGDSAGSSTYCPAADDCKIAYYNESTYSLDFADCNDAACTSPNYTVVAAIYPYGLPIEDAPSIYCPTADDCKIAYYGIDPFFATAYFTVSFVDCNDAACTGPTLTKVEVFGGAVESPTALYCPTATDCKIAYYYINDYDVFDLKFVDCNDAVCSAFTDGYNLGSSSNYFNSVYAAYYFGNQFTVYAFDLAEDYAIRDTSIEAGDVVVISSDQSGASLGNSGDLDNKPFVEKSNKSYQENLIGIISTKPAITFSDWQNPDDIPKRPVSLSGRVSVKVSLEGGPIEPGDYLTSSSQPGIAMKATEAGRVIGIALESYNIEEIGKIMVFVNPHWSIGQISDDGSLTLNSDETTNPEGEQVSEEAESTILDKFTLIIKNSLEKLGLFIKDGIVQIKELFAKKIRTEKLEMVDQTTGEIYCTWIENGEWIKIKGECDTSINPLTEPTPTPELTSTPEPTPELTPEPIPEGTPEPTPSTELDGDSSSEPTPESTPTPGSTPEINPEISPSPTPEITPTPSPEPTPTPELTSTPEPTPLSEPTPEPTPEPTLEPAPEPTP